MVGVAIRFLWERLRYGKGATSESAPPTTAVPPSSATPSAAPPAQTGSVSIPTPPEPRPVPQRARIRPSAPSLKLPQRIVLHVYAQGRLARDEVAPVELCQSGMSEALGEPQSHLSKPLARLVAGGVLTVDRRHVSRKSRRMLVYTLTPLGEALARDLRRSASVPAVPLAPAWMGRP